MVEVLKYLYIWVCSIQKLQISYEAETLQTPSHFKLQSIVNVLLLPRSQLYVNFSQKFDKVY